jgi:hypothetical protein
MKPKEMIAAFGKVERTKSQIDDIKKRIQAFADSNPYKVVSEVDPTGKEEVWFFKLTSGVPDDLAIVVGETLHNLRSPLDQTISAISVQAGHSGKHVTYCFGTDEQSFKSALAKQKKLLPADALDLIAASKPYPGGNDLLCALHDLNKGDKHYQELVPINLNQTWRCGFLAVEKGGRALIIGGRDAGHLVTDNYVPLARPPCPEDRFEFMTTTPGSKFHTDMRPAINVAFGKVQSLKREPIVAALDQMRQLVDGILLAFEKRFF